MSIYVVRNYRNRDNNRIILSKLKMSTLEKPKDLDSMADDVENIDLQRRLKGIREGKMCTHQECQEYILNRPGLEH